jgi:hypothetical protein
MAPKDTSSSSLRASDGPAHGPSAGCARGCDRRYGELLERGWRVSRGDIRRDVHRLLGGAYEEFLRKRL